MNAVLRWLVRLSARLLPGRHRDRFGHDLADTVSALAGDARSHGREVEREYLGAGIGRHAARAFCQRRDGGTTWKDLASVVGEALCG